MIESFNLDDDTKVEDWVTIIGPLLKIGWDSPSKLALVQSDQFIAPVAQGPDPAAAARVWEVSILLHADLTSSSILMIHGSSGNAENLIFRLEVQPETRFYIPTPSRCFNRRYQSVMRDQASENLHRCGPGS